MNSKFLILILAILLFSNVCWSQNDEGFIYGKVITKGTNVYKGQIRWGKEEIFWSDMMNTAKESNYNESVTKYKEESEKGWFNFDRNILKIWEDKYSGLLHQFTCRFGDIKSLEMLDDNQMILRLKNGHELKLDGKGYNDIGTRIKVVDAEFGEIDVDWDQVSKVEFSDTPTSLTDRLGSAIYGTVRTINDVPFEGYIQWDHDERIGSDLIQGQTEHGSVEIRMDNIAGIENKGDRSRIHLYSGDIMMVSGTNDVNKQNRGIIVTVKEMGRVDIPWSEFDRVDFRKDFEYSGDSYRTYHYPIRLKGVVTTVSGKRWEGLIVFDKDERWDVEHLDGNHSNLKYAIPFRNIRRIAPKNYDYSYVELKNGKEMLLGHSQDVSSKNEGLLIFTTSKEEPEYIAWKDVDDIVFE